MTEKYSRKTDYAQTTHKEVTMKKTQPDHHERLAIAGFIISIILASAAFYYIYQVQVNYGRTIEGLRDYACVQWQKENCQKGEGNCPCPTFT
mgnify:CR=1 FL=1